MRLAIDASALIWNTLLVGKDPMGHEVLHNEKPVWVNTADYGYENAINSILRMMRRAQAQPLTTILVVEGHNSKAPRRMIYSEYKNGKDKAAELYEVFQAIRERVIETLRRLGAIVMIQHNCEADDVLAWLADNTRQPLWIGTVDNDIAVLNKVNKYGARIIVSVDDVEGRNKYGDFPFEFISLYKAMVGDKQADNYGGIPGFGPAAWMEFHAEFGEAGMAEMVRMLEAGTLASELCLEAEHNKMVARIYKGRDDLIRCYKLAKLHPEWVNQVNDPIEWRPGFVQEAHVNDERLAGFFQQKMLVTADNFDRVLERFKARVAETPYFPTDLETSTPEESDDWLALQGKDDGAVVDVIGSEITGCSISFGANLQYCVYVSVDHADTNNCTLGQLAKFFKEIPKDKQVWAHNAQGFELAVMRNCFGDLIPANNGWRGFIPNMHDTRIASAYVDENRYSQGLKALTKDLFDYEQVTYQELTQGRKMREMTAREVVNYGCDDSYTAGGLANYFTLILELEGTLQDFYNTEQKPMYLQAQAYLQGVPLDMGRLTHLKREDEALRQKLNGVFNQFLITKGWDGSLPPALADKAELTPAEIKEAVKLSLGLELETKFRKLDKMCEAIRALDAGGSEKVLAGLLLAQDHKAVQEFVNSRFTANPNFNIGSPTQIAKLLYEVCGLPVRLRNKLTASQRAKGEREGNARTDDSAINLAIRLGDAPDEQTAEALKALLELKSINTRTSLYWSAYPGMVHWKTGKIHPTLRQSWTNTRRYSGSNPNVQQQEGSWGGVRSTFIPHKRNAIVVSLDESAQELRQLADYCQDEAMLSCYLGTKEQLRDIHSIVGARIAGVSYDDFRTRYKIEDKEAGLPEEQKTYPTLYLKMRQKAKITIFSLVYGATAPKIGETLGITEEEAQGYIDAIFAMFPGILAWKQETEDFVRQHGYVPIHGGGRRHLASLMLSEDRYTAAKALRQAGNSRIQASGGNQIKRIMTRIWDSNLLDDYDFRWYYSVHDEIIASVAKEHAAEVVPVLHGFMTEQYLNLVPSASSIGIGRNLGMLKELGEVFDMGRFIEAMNSLFEEKKEEAAA